MDNTLEKWCNKLEIRIKSLSRNSVGKVGKKNREFIFPPTCFSHALHFFILPMFRLCNPKHFTSRMTRCWVVCVLVNLVVC